MKIGRIIEGFLLSFVFLVFFSCIIGGIQWLLSDYPQTHITKQFSADVSAGVQNVVAENANGNSIQSVQTVQSIQSTQPALVDNSILGVNAKSAISVESNLQGANKVLFDKNSNMQLPIASLTKLMTAVVVLDNYNLSDVVTVDKDADSQDQIKQDVKLGDTMPVENFLEIMLIESSNKSAYVLSEKMGEQKFVGLMNQKAKDLGLQNTFFADPTGLSPEDVSTASDLTRLAEYILKNYPKIANISMNKELNIPNFGNITNTDQLLGEIPEVICSKTGFTSEANGCLLLVTNNPRNNDYLINIILGADDRFSEMKKIINYSNATCN